MEEICVGFQSSLSALNSRLSVSPDPSVVSVSPAVSSPVAPLPVSPLVYRNAGSTDHRLYDFLTFVVFGFNLCHVDWRVVVCS